MPLTDGYLVQAFPLASAAGAPLKVSPRPHPRSWAFSQVCITRSAGTSVVEFPCAGLLGSLRSRKFSSQTRACFSRALMCTQSIVRDFVPSDRRFHVALRMRNRPPAGSDQVRPPSKVTSMATSFSSSSAGFGSSVWVSFSVGTPEMEVVRLIFVAWCSTPMRSPP